MQVFGSDPELECFDSKLSRQGAKAAELFGFQKARTRSREVGNIRSSARDGTNDAFPLEVLKGTGNGVWVNTELGRCATRRRKRIA